MTDYIPEVNRDVVQGDDRIQFPEVLTADATQPIDLMAELEAAAVASTTASGPRRGRGRPRGSKNRTTLEREQQTGIPRDTPSRIVAPPSRRGTGPENKEPEISPEERKRIKDARAGQIEKEIVGELNDNIMLLLVGLGIPGELLYKPGHIPQAVTEVSKFTQWAGNVVIGPQQARAYAHLWAEIEQTETGKKYTGKAGGGKGLLGWYALLSLGSTVQYVQGLNNFIKELKPAMEYYESMKASQQQERNNQQQSQ